jgi:glutamyl-tRNA synthetase
MAIRVRFAPSPTGHVHIGNIRAAIFNWLLARHEGGKFLLRVEDTDRERSTPEAISTLLDVMGWLGLSYDEPVVYQTSMLRNHLEAAERLVAEGKAYRQAKGEAAGSAKAAIVFRMPVEEVPNAIRNAGPATIACHASTPVSIDHTGVRFATPSKKGEPVAAEICVAALRDARFLDAAGACLFDTAQRLGEIMREGKAFTVDGVSSISFTRREVFYRDLVKGELAKPLDGMKDLVIVRSDGTPVFHLANVCDDISQGITHIVRGDDHVENTYRHVLLYGALGATPPRYAHLPMIVNAQGKPYSKRDGDAYVGDFRGKGFLADALFNYLALLGWSPGDDREKMTRSEMIAAFTLERVKSGPAQMDLRKLTHLNGLYLGELPAEEFLARARDAAAAQPWGATVDAGYFAAVATLMRSRTSLFSQVAEWRYFFTDPPPADEKAVARFLRQPGSKAVLQGLRTALSAGVFDHGAIEKAIRAEEAAAGVGEGKLNQTARVAVTGTTIGAGLYETIAVLGRERTLARLDHAMTQWCA